MSTIKIVLVALAVLSSSCLRADGDPSSDTVFLIAKAKKVSQIRDNSFTRADGSAVIAPMTFKVKLEVIRTVYGDPSKLPEPLEVNLDTRNPEYMSGSEIQLLVDVSGKQLKVLHWDVVTRVACMPSDLVDAAHDDKFFKSPFSDGERMKCVIVR